MVERRGLFLARKRLGLIWGGDLPWLNSLVRCQKAEEQEDQGDPMAQYTSVLHQLLRYVPRDEFRAIVERHQGDKGVRKLSSWGQVVALFFGQLSGQHSLRDLVTT